MPKHIGMMAIPATTVSTSFTKLVESFKRNICLCIFDEILLKVPLNGSIQQLDFEFRSIHNRCWIQSLTLSLWLVFYSPPIQFARPFQKASIPSMSNWKYVRINGNFVYLNSTLSAFHFWHHVSLVSFFHHSWRLFVWFLFIEWDRIKWAHIIMVYLVLSFQK